MFRDSLEKRTYNKPSRNVLGEFAGYLQFCLLCQGALQNMTLSICGLLSSNGLAQAPTPIETIDWGNAIFKPLSKGVETRTSPKSLFLKTNKFFSLNALVFLEPKPICRLRNLLESLGIETSIKSIESTQSHISLVSRQN